MSRKGKAAQYSVMAYMGKEAKNKQIHIYVQLIHYTV